MPIIAPHYLGADFAGVVRCDGSTRWTVISENRLLRTSQSTTFNQEANVVQYFVKNSERALPERRCIDATSELPGLLLEQFSHFVMDRHT